MSEMSKELKNAYCPEEFRKNGHQIIDILADYLGKTTSGDDSTVLPYISPEAMLDVCTPDFKNALEPFDELIKGSLHYSNHLQSPRYIGHQVCFPLPLASLCHTVAGILNNSSAVYEMGPVNTAMEKHLIDWMCKLAGYNENSDGFFTSGGTLGNLTALLAARQAKAGYDIWTNGVKENNLCVLVSEQAHYSVQRAAQVMGIGERGAILVSSNDQYSMDIDQLQIKYDEAIKNGMKVIAVTGNACSTATGSYDDLEAIADFCESKDLWFHIDGAHGAAALISDNYKHLLKGAERADSIVWDAHKMMMMPTLITAVIFKNAANSYEAFSQKASYLFEKDAKEEWYNYGQRTMECTKGMMGLRLYVALKVYGEQIFADYIDYVYGLTQKFAEMIKDSNDFDIAIKPQSNIICFRHISSANVDISELQQKIRAEIFKNENFYITQAKLKDGFYLRCTIMNPYTSESHLKELMEEIRNIAKELI